MTEEADQFISFNFARKNHVFLISPAAGIFEIYCTPKVKIEALLEIQRKYGHDFNLHMIAEEEFDQKLNDYYENIEYKANNAAADIERNLNVNQLLDDLPNTEDLLDTSDDAPIIKLINGLLAEAIQVNASDIHFEIFKNKFSIRFRIDGVLHEIYEPSKNIATIIISRLKVMAKLDIAEKKIPQDGRINLKIANRDIDVRISILPSNHGERAVLRILDKKNAKLDLAELGANVEVIKKIESMIKKPNGIILVTGPTGSGKTTTLYAAISKLNQSTQNILTIEDPIEYDLQGIGQTQVNPKVGMTFAKGLRAILRQDPDIIMVGEIRDKETANIAIESSLTGHLVLSTLHTNNAIGAIVRLLDMGIPAYLLASSIIGVMAQRLVRKLCQECKVPADPKTLEEAKLLCDIKKGETIYAPKGCKACNLFGYRGRIGIYEIIMIDETIKKMIHDGASESEMKKYSQQKYGDLMSNACDRVRQGDTSIEEILRVTNTGNGAAS